MKTRLLVALDGSKEWIGIVRYLNELAAVSGPLDITLYHVLEVQPRRNEADSGDAAQIPEKRIPQKDADQEEERWLADRRSDIQRGVLEPARNALEGTGRNGSVSVDTEISVEARWDVAGNIIQKIQRDGYDALLLGRRRSSPEKFMLDQVTAKIMHQLHDTGQCEVKVVE